MCSFSWKEAAYTAQPQSIPIGKMFLCKHIDFGRITIRGYLQRKIPRETEKVMSSQVIKIVIGVRRCVIEVP